ISEGAGPSVGGTFLAVLLFGALGGALGGASTQRAPWLGELARLPLAVLSPLARPLFAGLDRLTARPRDAALTPARAWLYDGVLALVALGTVAIALAILSVATAPVVASFRLTTMVDQWVVALLVAVPPLYFIGALIAAFSAPPPVPAFAAPSPLGMPPGPSLAFGVPITVPPPMPPSGAFGTMPPMPPPSGTELER
nr:hypothetical protein [Ktedonobacterales bacterium]